MRDKAKDVLDVQVDFINHIHPNYIYQMECEECDTIVEFHDREHEEAIKYLKAHPHPVIMTPIDPYISRYWYHILCIKGTLR